MHTFPFIGQSLLLPDIVRAENCDLFDEAGNRYVDLESGIWCTAIGHAHPAVTKTLSRVMAEVGHAGFCYSSPMVEAAAETLLGLLGHAGGRCSFLCSGSEAVEYGVRALRTALPDTVVLTMADSYFGAYGDAVTKDAESWRAFDWFDCKECERTACDGSCRRFADINFDDVGGFLFEPGSSSGLVRFPPGKLVRALAHAVQERDGLLMVNEVTTGVGRTGAWFGFQHDDLKPDIVALGKGVGNGYPVSVCSLNAATVERLNGRPVPFGTSHYNDPAGAAVAQAVVGVIERDGLIQRAREMSAVLLDGLDALAQASPLIREVRGRGLMAAVEFALTPEETKNLHEHLVVAGYLTGMRVETSVLRLDPALTVPEAAVRGFLDALDHELAAAGT